MAVTYPAGQTRTYTAVDVRAPRLGPVTGGGVASVAFALRDLTDAVLLTVPATAAPGDNDWSAEIAFPATGGQYLICTVVTDEDGPRDVAFETVTLRRTAPRNGLSRTQLIERVAQLLGEDVALTATAASDGSVVTDERELNIEPGYMESRELFAVGGTLANVGEARRVASNTRAQRSLTVDPSFPAPVAVGDRFLVLNFRGTGFRLTNYVNAINSAIIDASGTHLVPVSADLPVTEGADRVALVALPETWSHLSGLDAYQGAYARPGQTYRGPSLPDHDTGPIGSPWKPVRRAMTRGEQRGGYWLDGRLAELNGPAYTQAVTTGTVRAHGYLMPEPLLGPDDYTTVNAEWLVAQACWQLLIGGLNRDPTRDGLAVAMQRRADALRPLIRTSIRANTVPLDG